MSAERDTGRSALNDMWIVGITGRSGNGKSTVAQYYASLGYPVCDGDAITREVYYPGGECLTKLVDAFGADILNADGTLNRKALGRKAFADEKSNKTLISITHPYIVKEFLCRAEKAREKGAEILFLDGAMIVNGPTEKYCNRIVLLVSNDENAIERIKTRDDIDDEEAMQRLGAQFTSQQMQKRASYTIVNNGDKKELLKQADEVLGALLQDKSIR